MLKYILLIAILIGVSTEMTAKNYYTIYDDLPGVIKSYKPSYSESYPDWAKMLYKDSVNVFEIRKLYDDYVRANPKEKSAISRYFKQWNRAIEPYLDMNGNIIMPDLKQLYKEKSKNNEAKLLSKYEADWKFLGPINTYWLNSSGASEAPTDCPWQVNIYAFDVSNTNPEILYCGTETGFVNKTTDNGETWTQLGKDYVFGGGVTAVNVDPFDSEIVYVSAGDQVHKSTDGGANWQPILNDEKFRADRMKIDPVDSDNIIAASNRGLFTTKDAGENWTKHVSYRTWDVDYRPDDYDTQYALCTDENDEYLMILSRDGGNTFEEKPFPIQIPNAAGGLIATSKANQNLILAILLSSDNEGTPYLYKGLFEESSGDINWELIATGETQSFPMRNWQGYFDLVLDISPDDEDIVMVGTDELYKSTDGGINFIAVGGYRGPFAIHPDIQDIKIMSGGKTWVSTDGGMTLSEDNFTSTQNYYSKNNGIIGSDMWGFDQGWNEDIIVGGRYHNGNTAIADFYGEKALRMGGAESPTGWVIHGKSRHVAFNDLGNGWILPERAESAPGGRFIFSKFPNMAEYGGRRGNLLHHPNYYNTLYLGEGNGFWRSEDMGQTFDLIHSFDGDIRYCQISFSNPDVIYIDVVGSGLYRSSDGGESWEGKPSLTDGSNGSPNWNGKLFFAISPTDENVIYACLSNGTWSSDLGRVYLSRDGGDSWIDYTGSISDYLKCIVIQPDEEGNDLVYLFSNSRGYSDARVYIRDNSMQDWETYEDDYPDGFRVNLAMPFFRDGKLRSAGNGGIWETPLAKTKFKPIVNPWVSQRFFDCNLDTLYFDDHSIINQNGTRYEWSIDPEPSYISDKFSRSPKVVLGGEGDYSVTLSITKDDVTYSRTIDNMVSTQANCPSLDNCNNPASIPKDNFTVLYTNSEETTTGGFASNILDDDPNTIWHTEWYNSDPPHPHEVQIDMGESFNVASFTYLPRSGGGNGTIKGYEFYLSENPDDFGEPVEIGEWASNGAPKTIEIPEMIEARFLRLVATSEVNENPWASCAEIYLRGCYADKDSVNSIITANMKTLNSYPLPTNDFIEVDLPEFDEYNYKVVNSNGEIINQDEFEGKEFYLNMSSYPRGTYFIYFTNTKNIKYRIKTIKN